MPQRIPSSSFLLCILTILLLFLPHVSSIFHPKNIPNPKIDPIKCGRTNNIKMSSICDPLFYMSTESQNVIEGHINEAIKYAQLSTLVIDQMDLSYVKHFSSIDSAAKSFAETVHNNWGVGDSTSQNGVLLFLSVKDRVVYISRGSGLAEKLSNSVLEQVIDHMRTYLRDKNYGRGVENGIVEISLIVSGQQQIISSGGARMCIKFFMLGVFILATMVFKIYTQRREDQMKEGNKLLGKFMREVSEAQQTDASGGVFMSSSCPICLEDFPVSIGVGTNSISNTTSKTYADSSDKKNDNYKKDKEKVDNEMQPVLESEMNESSNEDKSQSISKKDNPRRPMSLPCGHVFCHSCLMEHFKQSRNSKACPICRKGVDGSTPPPAPFPLGHRPSDSTSQHGNGSTTTGTGRPSCAETLNSDTLPSSISTSDNNANTRVDTHRWLEWDYRLNRMHQRYPTVIDLYTYRTINQAITNRNPTAMLEVSRTRQTQVTRTLDDMQYRREMAAKGGRGSSSGFGGGRSSGGFGGRF